MTISRRTALAAGGAALLSALVGCKAEKGASPGAAPTPGSPSASAPSGGTAPGATGTGMIGGDLKVALVLDQGGPDDKSFNAAAVEGVMRAKKELNVDERYVTSQDAADYQNNLTTFAGQGYDLIFAVGYLMEDAVKEVAPRFPNTKFAIVDGNAPDGAPNCASLQFHEEQGAFLVGYLAASVSKTKTIGFVGGKDISLIGKFEAGYRAGAKTADPTVKVITTYVGDWEDPGKGKNQAEQEFANGADVIFHAAGKSGLGVIQAAREKGPGFYAIGVDRDQDDEAPGRVLTSMIKKVDVAVFDTIKRVKEGRFQSGPQLYDLKSGGVGLSEMKFTKSDVPPAVLARVDKLKEMIANGEVVPPTTVAAVAGFVPPKL